MSCVWRSLAGLGNLCCARKEPPKQGSGESFKTSQKVRFVAPSYFLLISIDQQKLHLFDQKGWVKTYCVSTALNGVGQLEGTGQTPLGLHRIKEKIGDGASPYAIFKGRVDTGKVFSDADKGENLVIGRVLWLDGLEEGLNKGQIPEGNVDTHSRYIYIHATNHPEAIGQPVSMGCVRLAPLDMVDLYDRINDRVWVYLS